MVSHERTVVGGGAAGVSTGLMGAGKGANLRDDGKGPRSYTRAKRSCGHHGRCN